MVVPESADVGHDGIPGQFCLQSGLDLKLRVHSKRAEIIGIFSQYDLGEITADQLGHSLRSLGIHLTNAYYITLRKPPLTLAKFLHALTIPDGDRYNLNLTSCHPISFPESTSFDHSRQYAIFGEKWESENNKLRMNSSQVSRDVIRMLFKDLHMGLMSADEVANSITSAGIDVNARRQRLLANCERGSENGFRELVVEFQEPLIDRDDVQKEFKSEAARLATLDAMSRPASPPRRRKANRQMHPAEICTPNLTGWDHLNQEPTDWEKRNQDLTELKQIHVQRTLRSHVVHNGCLVSRIMEPVPKPLLIRPVLEDPQLTNMKVGRIRPGHEIIPPPSISPVIAHGSAQSGFTTPSPKPLRRPWGSDDDVVAAGNRVRPFSTKTRYYEVLSMKCCQEMANLEGVSKQH